MPGHQDLLLVFSNRPALQKELGAATDENIAIEACADDNKYPGLACVIQVFFFDAKAGALPDPSTTESFNTRTWNDYVFKWKWENQFELARSRWLPLSTLIFDPYIFMPKDVSDQLKAQNEATLYTYFSKMLNRPRQQSQASCPCTRRLI